MTVEAPTPSQAAVRLFAFFSRFEFALKEAGYVRADRFDGAQPDWSKFAQLPVVAEAYERIKLEPSLQGLIAQPPKQQVVVDNALGWREAAAVTSGAALIDAIKRVRNNLFHGGKSGENPRDDELCLAATKALTALLDVDVDLRARFLGPGSRLSFNPGTGPLPPAGQPRSPDALARRVATAQGIERHAQGTAGDTLGTQKHALGIP